MPAAGVEFSIFKLIKMSNSPATPAAASSGLVEKAIAFRAGRAGAASAASNAGLCCVPDPAELVRILQQEGAEPDPSLTIAAILRDIVQTTATKEEEITAVFGGEVAYIVAELTEDSKLSVSTRRALRLLRMPVMSRKAKLILFAEIIETVRQIQSKTAPSSWTAKQKLDYLDWAERVVVAMGRLNTTLLAIFSAELESARYSIASRTAVKSAR